MPPTDELLQILGALSQQSIDQDKLNRSSAQHANTLEHNRQSQQMTIDQQNLAILKDSLKTAGLQASQNEFAQTMQDSSDARGERLNNQKMKFDLELQKHKDEMQANFAKSEMANKLDILKLTHELAGKSDSVAYERAKNAKKTVDPNWTPNVYGLRSKAKHLLSETRGIGTDDWWWGRGGGLGSMINPYSDNDLINDYNKAQELLSSDVTQVQKKGVNPKHKEDIVRFLVDAFNQVNKKEFLEDDSSLLPWDDGDAEEHAIREDIISKLLQLDYPIDRNAPLNKKVNYK
jgi:hypothetical protein